MKTRILSNQMGIEIFDVDDAATGIGGFDITWQRSSSKSSWEAYPAGQNEVLRLTQI